MHKPVIVLLCSMLLVSCVPMTAQTPAPQIVRAQERIAPVVATVPIVPAPSLADSFLLPKNPDKSAAHFSYVFARTYEHDQGLAGLESLSPAHEVKTLFLRQSLLPLVQLWGGRLRLDGFTSTLRMQNVQLGLSAAGGLQDFRPARLGYAGLRSIDLYGVSLSFHFGRDAQIGRPTQIWRCLARIAGAVR